MFKLGGNAQNTTTQQPANPMDNWGKLWDTPKDGDKAPAFTLDDKVLGDVASKQDFMQGIDPALMERATNGDPKAMIELMGNVSRNAYKTAMGHGSMLTDKFVTAREGFNEKGLGTKVRKELTEHALADTPNFSHPVVRQQLTMIADRLQAQYPDLPPAEIAKEAKRYLTELAGAITPQKAARKAKAGEVGSTNWDDFIDAAPAAGFSGDDDS